ncbi:response regulator [Paenibacillus psychroresistens]|uniref:Circadian input-output histidine kinase CikA n=1 Tax=Paenibacillus psychroresistens TaxID=1778678 RepID=A0A6B8RUD3_9BACL|nr:response regulator [Paenibacillus psychroresistens]QGQ99215.1 response regulator [Paenibacillus psychroresistens]
MRWLKNLRINSKLMIMVLIPMLGLLYFSVVEVVAKLSNLSEMNRSEGMTKLAVNTNDVIHELQKEKGLVAGYYGKKTVSIQNNMLEQRKETSLSIDILKEHLKGFSKNYFGETFANNLVESMGNLDKLKMEQTFIDENSSDEKSVIAYYTDTIEKFFGLMENVKLLDTDTEISNKLSAYINFSRSKSAVSKERALLNNVFSRNLITPTDVYEEGLLVNEHELYFNVYTSFATPEALRLFKSIVKGEAVNEVDRMRQLVLSAEAGKNLDIDPGYWFNNSTVIIDSYKQVEDQYSTEFISLIEQQKSSALRWLIFVILLNLLIFTFSIILLVQILASFKKTTDEGERQYWLKTEFARLTELSLGVTDLQQLVKMLISEISELIEVGQGVFYVKEFGKNSEHVGDFILLGSYAYVERKNLSNRFRLGEGLIGQCALEKKPILLTQVPNDYIQISSGLGERKPLAILVLPILFEEEVVAVIELASFKAFTAIQQNLLELLSTPLGVVINSAASRQRTEESLMEAELLAEKALLLAKEAQTQQEELRVSNEELTEQTYMLKKSEEKLKISSEELQALNEEMAEKTKHLETQKVDILEQNQQILLSRNDLEVKAKELEMASKYKSEFLANMSHELRTPLNSLLILAKLLASNAEGNLSADQIESAEVIHSGGLELLTLINDILDLSKVEAGKLSILPEEVKLDTIINNLQNKFNSLAQDKGVHFELHRDEDTPEVIITDGQRTEQIMKNFLSNAFKFTSEGTVSLRISIPAKDVRLSNKALKQGRTIALIVTDTGIGIPMSKQKAIFEAFQQADGSISRKYGGTGLGLTISRELAKLLGGEIHLLSREGEGSTFTLFLPIDLETTTSERKQKNEAIQTIGIESYKEQEYVEENEDIVLKPIKAFIEDDREEIELKKIKKFILIVEDDKNFAKVLMELTRKKGFKSIVAGDGFSGMQLAKRYIPSAILLDLGLPDINGLKMLDLLKYADETRHIPVHIISGKDGSQDSLYKGAIGFLSKPVTSEDIDTVFSKIENILDDHIKQVLVIEDDAHNQKAIYELLKDKNIEIHIVNTGKEGLDRIKQQDYDCVILDLKLSDMTGFELLTQLIDAKVLKIPPIVINTGKELTEVEYSELNRFTESIVIKGVNSPGRLLDEVSLFLHSVQKAASSDQRQLMRMLSDSEETLNGRKILIVDDDLRNIFALSKILQLHGVEVVMADNGKLALEKLEEEAGIELVVMDIMMPIMDGYEAMRLIRENHRFSNLPIIALTAKAMTGDREKCIEAGANDYMTKPINSDNLLSLIRVWLFK